MRFCDGDRLHLGKSLLKTFLLVGSGMVLLELLKVSKSFQRSVSIFQINRKGLKVYSLCMCVYVCIYAFLSIIPFCY